MHTERVTCEDEDRDQDDAPISQGISKAARNHQKLQESHRTDSSSQPPEGTKPVDTLILNF